MKKWKNGALILCMLLITGMIFVFHFAGAFTKKTITILPETQQGPAVLTFQPKEQTP